MQCLGFATKGWDMTKHAHALHMIASALHPAAACVDQGISNCRNHQYEQPHRLVLTRSCGVPLIAHFAVQSNDRVRNTRLVHVCMNTSPIVPSCVGKRFHRLAKSGITAPRVVPCLQVGADEKLSSVIDGESLVNDGSALVIFLVLQQFVEGASLSASEVRVPRGSFC